MPSSKLDRIFERAYNEAWAITEQKAGEIVAMLELRSEGYLRSEAEISAIVEANRRDREIQVLDGGVAILPVMGFIEKRMNIMSDFSGGTSTDRLKTQLEELVADDSVSSIVLDIDSGGGSVHGPAELAETIFQARSKKKIVAVANEVMASGAYWIGAAANELVIAETGTVGSIGVIGVIKDVTAAEQAQGIKSTIIQAGARKADGRPEKPLDDEARAALQEMIDAFYGRFVGAIARFRGMSEAAVRGTEAGVFIGSNAVDAGLADRVGTLGSVVKDLSASAGRSTVFIAKEPEMAETKAGAEVVDTDAQNVNTQTVETLDVKSHKEVREDERKRISAINNVAIASEIPVDSELVVNAIDNGLTTEQFKASAFDHRVAKNTPPSRPEHIGVGQDESEKFMVAVGDALSCRLNPNFKPEGRSLAPGASELRNESLYTMAKECVVRVGGRRDLASASRNEIIRHALGWSAYGLPDITARSGGSGMVPRTFPNILLDAQNKQMMRSFEEMETRTTYQMWARQAPSVSDYKDIHQIKLSEAGDLDVLNADGTFPEDRLTDTRETYAVETRGKAWSISRETIINDDLNALTRTPQKYGASARRTINRFIYMILKLNQAMNEDDLPVFDAGHNNLVTPGAPPDTDQLNAMQRLLRKQLGLRGIATLNFEMTHVITSTLNEGVLLELLSSQANPSQGGDVTGSSGVNNIWRGRVTPVIEPELEFGTNADVNAWYGLDSSADFLEYSFLQGEETPVIEDEFDFDTKGRKYTIHQTYGAKVVEYRGAVKNVGTPA